MFSEFPEVSFVLGWNKENSSSNFRYENYIIQSFCNNFTEFYFSL